MKNPEAIGSFLQEELSARGISETTAEKFGIFTARYVDGDAEPEAGAEGIAFPFTRQGKRIGISVRLPEKRFLWTRGSEMALWNEDVLRDQAVLDGQPVIITEGIWDALTAIDAGFQLAVSVPNGAPMESDEELPPLELEAEQNGRFKCLYTARDQLKRVRRFIIAVDSDGPGRRLAAELVRRLSAARCSFVTYPEDCKDLSDVRQWYGEKRVVEVIAGARPYPLHGLYRLSEYPPAPDLKAFSVGWPYLDQHFKMIEGEFFVCTGIPGHGKSTFMHNVCVNVGRLYDWRCAIFSPENPAPTLRNRLRSIYSGYAIESLRPFELEKIDRWLDEHILFIDGEPLRREGDDTVDFDLAWLLDRAADAVLRDGIKLLLIDPWNEIEHARAKNESVTDYIGRSIRQIGRFRRDYGVAVGVVAHPTKDVAEKGKARPPTLYDIEGSAHWFNKCDHGLVVDLPDRAGATTIRVPKSRFSEIAGEPGQVKMKFQLHNFRFVALDVPADAPVEEELPI